MFVNSLTNPMFGRGLFTAGMGAGQQLSGAPQAISADNQNRRNVQQSIMATLNQADPNDKDVLASVQAQAAAGKIDPAQVQQWIIRAQTASANRERLSMAKTEQALRLAAVKAEAAKKVEDQVIETAAAARANGQSFEIPEKFGHLSGAIDIRANAIQTAQEAMASRNTTVPLTDNIFSQAADLNDPTVNAYIKALKDPDHQWANQAEQRQARVAVGEAASQVAKDRYDVFRSDEFTRIQADLALKAIEDGSQSQWSIVSRDTGEWISELDEDEREELTEKVSTMMKAGATLPDIKAYITEVAGTQKDQAVSDKKTKQQEELNNARAAAIKELMEKEGMTQEQAEKRLYHLEGRAAANRAISSNPAAF